MSDQRAVTLPRPESYLVPTPEQAFRKTDWNSFAQAVEKFKVEARKRLGLLEPLVSRRAFALRSQRSRCEPALALALVDQCFLLVRRKRFSPLFPLRFSRFFSWGVHKSQEQMGIVEDYRAYKIGLEE
jgi:hypothetical protein